MPDTNDGVRICGIMWGIDPYFTHHFHGPTVTAALISLRDALEARK